MINAASSGRAGSPPRRESRIRSPERQSGAKPHFYPLMGALMLVLTLAGFWPQYFSAPFGGTMADHARHWIVHLHAAIFTGWMAMFIAQALAIRTGRGALHHRLGPWMAGYGFAAAAFGLVAGLALVARSGARTGSPDDAASFAFAVCLDMALLAAFLAVAVANTKRPDIHKRAMLVATYCIAFVGIARLVGHLGLFETAFLWQPAMLSPLLIALARDALIERRLHPVLAAATLIQGARLYHEAFSQSALWLPVGRALIAPFS